VRVVFDSNVLARAHQLAHGPARRLVRVYNQNMGKHVIHISEDEAAATNVATLLAHVRAGAEVIIENGSRAVAVLHPAEPVPRTISECIALLPEDSTATVDPDFAGDVAAAARGHRESLNPPTWD
jgi:antitoxin (DNA-binding transcriptional repressor) of toxin-antitoxin stability system